MRVIVPIVLFIVVLASCKGKQIGYLETPKNDTVQFTYMYSEGLKNKMLGRTEVAEKQFIQCLHMKPKSSASAYQLAMINIDRDNLVKAKEYAEICLKLRPKNEWYVLLRAEIAQKEGKREKYIQLFEKLIEINPANYNYNYELAIAYFKNEQYNQALSMMNFLEEEVGINENISFLKNNINYALKKFEAIKVELVKLTKSFPDSIKYADMLAEYYLSFNQEEKALNIYKKIIEKDSLNVNARIGLAWIYGKLGKYKIGYPYLMESLVFDNIEFKRKEEISSYYLAGEKTGVTEDSIIEIYDILIDDEHVTSEFISQYVEYLFSKKNFSKAEKVSLLAINKYPDDYTIWDYYFNILLIQNRPEALKKYTKKGLEYFPNQASIYFYSGYANFLLKDYKEAVSYLEMGKDYVIDNEDLEKQFYLTLAESLHNLGKHKQSDNYFDKYLEKDSSNAYLMNNYAYYLVQRNNNLEKALDLSRKSIEIEPFNSSFLDTYSWVLYNLSKIDKALNYIQRAYKYGGNKNPVILDHYAEILLKSGNNKEAVERWHDAYNLTKSQVILEKINKVGQIEN